MLQEPLDEHTARRLLRSIVESGTVHFTGHALDEMRKDRMAKDDVLAILRSGLVEPAEFENGSWRYRVRRFNLWAVVAFRSETNAVVVTAWRSRR